MIEFLIVVNGVPGSGKTTLAGPLAAAMRTPLLAKDRIKEALFDSADGAREPVVAEIARLRLR